MKNFTLIFISIFLFTLHLSAQLKPYDAAKLMQRGINIGNTMESPVEGTWGNPPITKRAFGDYKNAGFTAIRIPITWDMHIGKTSPYKIDEKWMTHVEQIVDTALSRGLIIIINAHHDGWIKDSYTEVNKVRFDSLWSQIATRFKDKSDNLIFEMINEPNPITQENINDLNKRTLKTIRKTNPTRIVCFSGYKWSNSQELVVTEVPDTADHYLMGYYHSYDPYPFGLNGPGTYGSDADIATTVSKFKQVSDWAKLHNIPVMLGEFGFMKDCEYNSRMCAYATIVDKGIAFGVPTFAWDDNGDFPVYNRTTGEFNEIKDILIHTYPVSPNKMKISIVADTLIKVQWTNRTKENDSIVVERKVGTGNFEYFKTIAPNASEFTDSTTSIGKAFYYRLKANLKDSIEIQSYPIMMRVIPIKREPFYGKALSVPGLIEAEDYDKGGEGLTYHDTDEQNLGGSNYRSGDGVDIGEQATGSYHVGYVATGEWLEYTINVAEAGKYQVTASYAAGGTTAGGTFKLTFGNKKSVTFATEATGSWTSYGSTSKTVTLSAGEQVMRLSIESTPAFDLDDFLFTSMTKVENFENEQFSIFPNPAKEILYCEGQDEIETINIYNLNGRMLKLQNVGTNNAAIRLDDLSDGVYVLKISSKHAQIYKQFVKQS